MQVTAEPTPLVSIILLNWNGLEHTKLCLGSIKNQTCKNHEIIVVDNGSADSSTEYFKTLHDIKLVALPSNTGFTGGNIEGLKVAQGDYIALINNDLVLDEQWLTTCLEVFSRNDKAAAVGGKAFFWNSEYPAYNFDNPYYAYQEVDPITAETRTLLAGEVEKEVNSISGAALMLDRQAIDKVGFLDNDFFAYYEETDLIARLIRAGYSAIYSPRAAAWHKIGGSTEGGTDSFFYFYHMYRNRYIFACKNFDEPNLTLFLKSYRQEYKKALLNRIINPDGIASKAFVDAYRWNRSHNELIAEKRKNTIRMGSSYIDKISAAPEQEVTVIIPSYNYADYIGEAIESAINQSLKPKRIIVIDDGSTDSTKNVLDRYKDNPLIDIVYKQNSGVIATKNLGISMSKTYWTIFLVADDVLKCSYIADVVEAANECRADIVYTAMKMFGASNSIFKSGPFTTYSLLKGNYIHNSALIKTTFLKQVGGYKKEMSRGLEDWELYISLVELGAKPHYLPEAIFHYRQHSTSASRTAEANSNKHMIEKQIRLLHPAMYKKYNPCVYLPLVFIKYLSAFIIHPGIWIVTFKSLPKAFRAARKTILREQRLYITSR